MRRTASGYKTLFLVLLMLLTSAPAFAAKRRGDEPKAAETVELFAAIKAGDIAVKLIPKDVKEANLLIENKANRPLTIKLPEAFAGVPVLAQIGGGFGGGGLGGGGGGGGGQQGIGGGFGGGGGGFGGGGQGGGGQGGFFNVAPDRVGKIKVATVCLEHGKRDPNPRVPYEIRPIESFTKDQKVIEVVKMLGRGEVPRNTAQATVWHLANGLSWPELAHKDRVRLRNGYVEKYFAPQEIALAMRVAAEAARRTEKHERTDDGRLGSLSQR